MRLLFRTSDFFIVMINFSLFIYLFIYLLFLRFYVDLM